ncbi:amidase [Castellaniella sp.]|uniref:amidase n=1 Tax=Castellaniella sp. TaxID=1955812 RepID=UPI0035669EF1
MDDIIRASAGDLARHIARRKISALETASAFLDQIQRFNPALNAIITLAPDILDQARARDERLAKGGAPRPLEGVPFVVKDNILTKNLRTTYGSYVLQNHIPEENAICVQRILDAGGVLLGKTNTSEFATDINTSNPLFGLTRNPIDLNISTGGSSGGSAAAIAADFAPIGLGTDLGGSIRIPAAWCGISGLRPSPGRVPVYPSEFGWDTLVHHVQGPMARHVEDLGLLLSVIAGQDDRDPISLPTSSCDYEKAAAGLADLRGLKIAYCANLGGIAPVDPEIERLAKQAAAAFQSMGCTVDEACFNASDIKAIIAGTRGYGIVARFSTLVRDHGNLLTTQLIGQLEDALKLDLKSVAQAERLRTQYWQRVRAFQDRYDLILTPTVGAPPFRLDEPLPDKVGNQPVARYYDIFLLVYAFTLLGLPAASVPCGYTASGAPAGLQIVGRRMREDQVLNAASAYTHFQPHVLQRRPIRLDEAVELDYHISTPGMRSATEPTPHAPQ